MIQLPAKLDRYANDFLPAIYEAARRSGQSPFGKQKMERLQKALRKLSNRLTKLHSDPVSASLVRRLAASPAEAIGSFSDNPGDLKLLPAMLDQYASKFLPTIHKAANRLPVHLKLDRRLLLLSDYIKERTGRHYDGKVCDILLRLAPRLKVTVDLLKQLRRRNKRS